MIKYLTLNDWDLEQVKTKGYVQSGEFIVMKKDVFEKLPDDTFIKMDKQMLNKFKEFCKATTDNNDFKAHKSSPKDSHKCLVCGNLTAEENQICIRCKTPKEDENPS